VLGLLACGGVAVETAPLDTAVPADTGRDSADPPDSGNDTQAPHERTQGDWRLADARARVVGEAAGDAFGHGLQGLGDLDGDGLHELGFGAPGQDGGLLDLGALYVSEGALAGDVASAGLVKLVGRTVSQQDHLAVARGGDLDGDGLVDALVGHAQDDAAGQQAGAVFVIGEALASGDLAGASLAVIVPDRTQGFLGVTTDGLGDMEGDGVGDLLVGTHADAAWVLPGPLAGTLVTREAGHKVTGTVSGGRLGIAVAGIGDTDGDGLTDMLVSCHGDDLGGSQSGAGYVLLGPITGDRVGPVEVDGRLYNEGGADQQAAEVVAAAGDVDGDGFADVLLGSFSATEDGDRYRPAAWLVRGPATGVQSLRDATRFDGPLAADELSLDGAGDVDGDGAGDLVFGSWSLAPESGAWLVYGPASGGVLDAADLVLVPEAADDAAGASVAGGGDLDGDGRAEVLVGGFSGEGGKGVAGVVGW